MRDFNREILIVEDEIKAGEALKEMLEFRGCIVSLETSGKSAVNMVCRTGKEIGVILMDIDIPGEIDGIEAVRQIQQEYPQIPVILLTAYSDEVYRQRIIEEKLEIAGIVEKPILDYNKKKLLSLTEKELKKQLRKKIEEQLSGDSLPHIIQSLIKELISGYWLSLLVEVVKDMEKTRPSNPLNMDEVWPFLNFMAFQNMKNELEKDYPGQFAAFLDGVKVGQNQSRDDLIREVYEKFKRTDIFITKITGEPRVIKFRRPVRIFR